MTLKTRRSVGTAALTLGLAVLMLILILGAVHGVGTDAELYFRLQTEAGVLPEAGVCEADLRTLDGALARFLAGQPEELMTPSESAPGSYDLLALNVDGALRPAFNDREVAHLRDCEALFALLRKVRRRLIPWAVLLVVGGAYLLQDRRRARKAALLSPLIPLAPLGAFALWAVIDFDGAFVFFHRVLFDNDLWLLDPATDLLIRICPESMFMSMGRMIALRGLAILAAVPALAVLASLIWPKSKSNGGNQWNDNRAMRRAAAQRPKTFDAKGMR